MAIAFCCHSVKWPSVGMRALSTYSAQTEWKSEICTGGGPTPRSWTRWPQNLWSISSTPAISISLSLSLSLQKFQCKYSVIEKYAEWQVYNYKKDASKVTDTALSLSLSLSLSHTHTHTHTTKIQTNHSQEPVVMVGFAARRASAVVPSPPCMMIQSTRSNKRPKGALQIKWERTDNGEDVGVCVGLVGHPYAYIFTMWTPNPQPHTRNLVSVPCSLVEQSLLEEFCLLFFNTAR